MLLRRPVSLLDRWSQSSTLAFGIALVALVGWIDFATGRFSFWIFYLVPIALVSWFGGRSGVVVALLSAVVWGWIHLSVAETTSDPLLAYWSAVTKVGVFVLGAMLLMSLRDALQQESDLARRDSLTGAANMRSFMEMAGDELDRSRRYGRPFTVAYIDIDDFKRVNDSFGHTVGNDVLRWIAEVVDKNSRTTDTLARLGGDEFAMLLPETDFASAEAFLSKIKALLSPGAAGNTWSVTVSVGAVSFISAPGSVDEILGHADHLMYAAKHKGKNRIAHERAGDPRVRAGVEADPAPSIDLRT